MSVLDLESLACVDALARTLSFHRGARACALSPAAFGKRIKQVEDQLGKALFHRTTRRVELTPEGAALIPKARQLLADASELVSDAKGEAPPMDLTLGTRHELGLSWLMPARRLLKSRIPHLTIHLVFGNSEDLEAAVLGMRTDACVLSRMPATTRLDSVLLHQEDYVLVASPRLLKRTPLQTPMHSARHVLIDTDAALPLFRYLRPRGAELRFRSILHMGTIAAVRAALLDQEGVGVLPRYFVQRDLDGGRLSQVLQKTPMDHDNFRLIFRADDPRRELFEEAADVLRQMPLK
jgi:DNA-binding transcriptional LysR family regulator